MAGFLALGTGFVNAANERQKENRDERRETRKLAMEVFLKDSLPRIRASRAKDDEAVTRMNTLMADSYYKGQPGLAFYATKWMGQTGKDESAFREHVATNQIPQPLREAQQAELQKHFNYREDTNSFSWKDSVPPVQPAMAPQGRQPNWYDRIMGGGKEAKDIQQGTSTVAKAAGVDPNASTTSRFDNITLPGSFQSTDPKAQRMKDQATEFALRNPDKLRNHGAFLSALASGDQKKIDEQLANPKFTVSREEAKADQINQAFRMGTMEGYLRGDFGRDNDMLRAIIQGNSEKILQGVTKNMKTDEEKLAQAAKMKKIEIATGSLDSPEAFLMMRKGGLLGGIDIPEANLALMEAQATQAIKDKQDWQTQILLAEQNKGKKPEDQITIGDVKAAGQPQQEAVDPKEVEAAMYEPGGLVIKQAKPAKEAVVDKGEALLKQEEALNDIAVSGAPELIRSQRDPVKLLQAATRSQSDKTPPGRQAEIAKNLTLTPEVASRILNDTEYGNEFQSLVTSQVEPYLDEFATLKEAQAVVHPYGLAKVNGNLVVVPPKRK